MVEAEQVDRAPHRGVEEHAGLPAERACELAEVGDARVRDDQLRFGIGVNEPREVVGDWREPAPAVDQDRHAPLRREREHRRQALVVEQEPLRPRMQLDPARACVEAAGRLLDRLFGEVEPHERNQASLRALRVGECAVVRGAERRVPVGLVHAEHECPSDPVPLLDLLEVVVDAAEAVDVVAEVDVGVEDLGVLGQLAGELLVVAGDQCLRPLEDFVHGLRV